MLINESGVRMVAWLIYFKENAIYNQQYIEFYRKEGNKFDIEVMLILVEELSFGVENNAWYLRYQGLEISYPDFVICRAIYPLLSRHLEFMGMRVFNNSFVSEICNDKAKTYQYLAKIGIKMVDSSFYLHDQVKDVLQQVKETSVVKAVAGHGGSQVFLVEPYNIEENMNVNIEGNTEEKIEEKIVNRLVDKQVNNIQLEKILQGLVNSDVVVQPLTGNRHQDLRVYVIGKEIIACVLRTAKQGFKSNFSLGGEVCLYDLSEEEHLVVNQIINQFDFGLVGIDFIIGDQGELIFNEIEDVVGSRMLYQCAEINIVELYLKHILKNITQI